MFRLYESICEDPVKIPINLDDSLKDLLQGMLTKDPYQRLSVNDVSNHWYGQITLHSFVLFTIKLFGQYAYHTIETENSIH